MWSFSPRCIRLEILIVFKVMDVQMCMCTFVRLLLLKLNNRTDAVLTVAVCIVSGPLHLSVVCCTAAKARYRCFQKKAIL